MPRALSRLARGLCDDVTAAFPRQFLLNASRRRYIQIQPTAVPNTDLTDSEQYGSHNPQASPNPDARFEVLGAPQSLLSVQLSASQNFYTRRGTLVAVNGRPENAVSTLSMLEPIRRSILGIPFLYQRITSTTPITALIASKSPITSFAVVHLDGRLDWIVAQRSALLAWTGHTLKITPSANFQMSAAHWGNSQVTGRGLVALVGNGQIYQIQLKAGEDYVVHPSNVVAYSVNQVPPTPYRFKSTTINFQIPSTALGKFIPDVKFFKTISETKTWKTLANALFTVRTWARRSVFGDRLFMHFHGPMTILLQSRGSRLTDSLTTRDVNEIADSPSGAVHSVTKPDLRKVAEANNLSDPTFTFNEQTKQPTMSFASVGGEGRVKFEKE